MSKLAKIPIEIKENVTVTFEGSSVKVSGPKGILSFSLSPSVGVKIENGRLEIGVKDKNEEKIKELLGLTRAMIANMVTGVSAGFSKKLELSGVGYRAKVSGNDLELSVGFSHPVSVVAPSGIAFAVSDNFITVSGIDKSLVGNTAASIRSIRPPEPYKGKGIKYVGERIRRKAGKAAKTLGAK
jgi:large subunit ribosomal protein L6